MKWNVKEIISIMLLLFSISLFLYLIYYYQVHSPQEFVTHTQFYETSIIFGTSLFAGLLSVWIHLSNKLTEFAQQLGELQGTLNQYIKNHPRR